MPAATQIQITLSERITAVAYPAPARSRLPVCLVLAHGAGANQAGAFMVQFATTLAERGIGTLTFNFLYSEKGRRIPDRNDMLETCYRKVIQAFHDGVFDRSFEGARLVIGGKSMGGRIASQVAASDATKIAGLVFLGYPLHPPGRPQQLRTAHLPAIRAPMLFIQGARDAFGTPEELRPVIQRLKAPAELCVIEGADHSFKIPKRAGGSQAEAYELALKAIELWLLRAVVKQPR